MALANGAASVAVTVPRSPPYESVTCTVLFVAPAWLNVKPFVPLAVSLGVNAAALFQLAVAVFVPL